MKTLVMVFARAAMLCAQWPLHPTAGVPKTADGKPDFNAPTPRTADGRPDLSGVWENVRVAAAPSTTGLGPTLGSNQFWDIGYGMKGGLPYQPWAKELLAKRMGENSKDNPDAHCLPMGLMQLHTHPQPRKIIQTPSVIVILYEGNSGIRQVFTDGRPLPPHDAQPWWYGYSVGKWDGDTLVVETTGFRDDGWLDVNGSPLTEAGKMTERFRRVNYGNLDIEVTVDDPKAYTKPWTAKMTQRIMLDTELIEFVCNENEKSVTHLVGK
jgi:hypothetical protein